jgi:hypothetical protein
MQWLITNSTIQDCPNLWDPSLEIDLDTLWSIDLTNVNLGPDPAPTQAQRQDTVMTGTADPDQQSVSRAHAQPKPQAQNQNKTAAQNETDREWNIFIGQTIPDRLQLIEQYNAQYRAHAQQHQQSSSTSTPTISTVTPTPRNQLDELLNNPHPSLQPKQPQPPARKEALEKDINALARRLALEKDYLCERHNRLIFFNQCLASLREILQHERLQSNKKVGLEEWIADMTDLVHDLRAAIDGDEESVREIEGRLKAVFRELSGFSA